MRYLYQNKYWKINKDYNIDKLLYLMIDRPNQIIYYYNFVWRDNKNKICRDYDLPAWINSNVNINITWGKNGKHHRKNNKPAVITFNDYKEYYINGNLIKSEKPK